MKFLTLEIPQYLETRKKKTSYLINFPDKTVFYFKIQDNSSIEEINHLTTIGKDFFSSQFDYPIHHTPNKFITLRNEDYVLTKQMESHEISWEIFYTYNHWIKIKPDVYDDTLDWDISGFTGRIINFFSGEDEDIYQIEYSGHSLKQMPIENLQNISRNISPFFTYLEPEFIMPYLPSSVDHQEERVKVRILEKILNHKKQSINPDFSIHEISSFLEIIQNWETVLQKFLVANSDIQVRLSNRKKYQLINIHGSDEFWGVWGNFLRNKKHCLFPITEIVEIGNSRELQQTLKAYKEMMNLVLPN